jgi:cyclophilin family peptidyl-prolyl cis-trans isomerase
MKRPLIALALLAGTIALAQGAKQAAYYLPTGFKLTAFLSAAPQRTFKALNTTLAANTDYRAVIETTAGRLVIDLYEKDTPFTVGSFVWLTRHHYYDGIAFHRVIEDFMAQTGDPNTLKPDQSVWGQGGTNYQFGLETTSKLSFDAKGMLGMARSQDPNSNSSQFFITVAPAPHLNGQYTIFGKVVEGATTLDKIARGEPPEKPTRINRAYIIEKKQ